MVFLICKKISLTFHQTHTLSQVFIIFQKTFKPLIVMNANAMGFIFLNVHPWFVLNFYLIFYLVSVQF